MTTIKCRCGRTAKDEDEASTSFWSWRETKDGLEWTCPDCAIENEIETLEVLE
jgi:hypothetical protein